MTQAHSPDRPSLILARAVLRVLPTGVPNTADKGSKPSMAIARELIRIVLGDADARGAAQAGQTSGSNFEDGVQGFLETQLRALAPDVPWEFGRGTPVNQTRQYAHLAEVAKLVAADQTGLLRDALGADHVIKPDVTIERSDPPGIPVLHASVSCKWTIRSDRVQNARHEANVLLRHRHGRAPHIVVVTAEPLPSRIASIARGTGEIDCTYHLALPELSMAVHRVPNLLGQSRVLDELMANGRLADLSDLPRNLLL